MNTGSLDDTVPTPVNDPPSSGNSPQGLPPAEKGPSWKILALVSFLTLFIIAGMSAFGGYRSGLYQRSQISKATQSAQTKLQFDLGVQDLENKNYDQARQRFEWILQVDPGYPGAADHLADAMVAAQITATFTPIPTSTLIPTPDTRTIDEMYNQIKQAMAGGDWTKAIDSMLSLRKVNPQFHAVEIDGNLWVALRNRGIEKIKKADLEGGTYDLASAEKFGPLDSEALNWRNWAEWYTTGASYWELDWTKVIYYFQQLYTIVPNLSDGSGWTATDRYRIALGKYGDQLAAAGNNCKAVEQYNAALDIKPDPLIRTKADQANEKCQSGKVKPPEATQLPGETPTVSITVVPIVQNTPTRTPAPTAPAPTNTPAPTTYP